MEKVKYITCCLMPCVALRDCGIKWLYMLYTDKKNVYYGVDVDTTKFGHEYGSAFEVSYQELKSVFDGKIYELVHNESDFIQTSDAHTGNEMEMIAENVNDLLQNIRSIMLNIAENLSCLREFSSKTSSQLFFEIVE